MFHLIYRACIKVLDLMETTLNRCFTLFFFKGSRNKFSVNSKVRARLKVGNNVTISSRCKLHGKLIELGSNVFIHENVQIRSLKSIKIGDNTTINRNTCILDNVVIGNNVAIAPNCVIVGSNHVFKNRNTLIKNQGYTSKGIIIQDNVWIGANVSVLDGVEIGEGVVVAAGSVVTRSVLKNSVIAGVPATVIKER